MIASTSGNKRGYDLKNFPQLFIFSFFLTRTGLEICIWKTYILFNFGLKKKKNI